MIFFLEFAEQQIGAGLANYTSIMTHLSRNTLAVHARGTGDRFLSPVVCASWAGAD
jgi:hypothetical protein